MEKEPTQAPQPEALDSRWYNQYELITSGIEVTSFLEGNDEYREEQKNAFLAGNIENPILDNNIDPQLLEREERELIILKEEIIKKETNEVIKQAYRWKINERLATLRMLKAAKNGDMRRFQRYSEFIYGRPDSETFFQTIALIYSNYSTFAESGDEQVQKAFNDFFSALNLGELGESSAVKKPSDETIVFVKKWANEEISDLDLDIKIRPEKYKFDEIISIFQDALDKIGAERWQATIRPSGTGISTNQAKRLVEVPESRQVGSLKLKQLVLHEIRTHVEKRIRGESSKLSLLGLGLDRYEGSEEGIATMKEQGLSKEFKDFSGLEGHLAVSLALGIDGKPRNFRETFEILKNYFYLIKRKNGQTHEEAINAAKIAAWKRCVRTFRGTDCKTPGACFTKDIIYREGNIAIWDLVGVDNETVYKFSIGKYDPTNPRHLWILSQLEITDGILEKLESN